MLKRDSKGRFIKGFHYSSNTEFRKGESSSPETQFKKGFIPWSKGRKFKQKNKAPKRFGDEANSWKGGFTMHATGYRQIRVDNDYIFEHRYLLEKAIGRKFKLGEQTHHINKIKADNRLKNLMLFSSDGAHKRFEHNLPVEEAEIIFDGRAYA